MSNYTLKTFMANNCTVGKLYDDHGKVLCVTIEKPWLNNENDISCVPSGVYSFKPRMSPSQGATYYLENKALGVSLNGEGDRTYIQIDVANTEDELLGCIAVGKDFSVINGKWAVTSSRKTKEKLLRILDAYDHTLTIERF